MAAMTKRARKPYLCAHCGKTIAVGEPMALITTAQYGLAVTHPQCRPLWIREQRRVPANAR